MLAASVRFAFAAMLFFTATASAQTQRPMVQVTVKSAKEVMTKFGDMMLIIKKVNQGDEEAEWPQGKQFAQQLATSPEKVAPGFDVNKPLGLRVMYKAPVPPTPIDGDFLLMIPVTDANKFVKELLSKAPLPNLKTEDGVTQFDIPNTGVPVFGREGNEYFYVTVANADVISAARQPKPSDVFGSPDHDLSIAVNPGVMPESIVIGLLGMLKPLYANIGIQPHEQLTDEDVKMVASLDSLTLHFDILPDKGKIAFEVLQTGRPGTALADSFKTSPKGRLRSSFGLAPNAVAAISARGGHVVNGETFKNTLNAMKRSPLGSLKEFKQVSGLVESLAKSDVDDVAVSVLPDATVLFGAAVKSAADFELKVNELFGKNDVLTLAGVKLRHVEIPLPNGDQKARLFLGVKDNVALVAVAFSDDRNAIEEALKRAPVEDHDAASIVVRLKELAKSVGVDGYKGDESIRIESQGTVAKFVGSIPVKDLFELQKLGVFTKLQESAR